MAHPTAETITDRIRHRIDAVLGRVRGALDLPSRTELLELTRRLEELDRRIATLAAERVAAMSTVVPALPEPIAEAAPVAASETVAAAASETAAEPEPEAGAVDPRKNGKKAGTRQRKK